MAVYFYGCMTLDGYLADKFHNLDWLYQSGDVDLNSYQKFYNQMDITIMGRKTFNAIMHMDNLKDVYPSTTNYVFSNQKDLAAEGFTFVSKDIVTFVKNIPSDKNIWIIGGQTILKPLLDNNLIDYMYVQIAPVLLGDGIRLFTQKEQLKRFKLLKVNQYQQFAELIYEKI